MYGWVKTWNDPMIAMTTLNMITGLSIGIVIWKVLRRGDAPSRSAAS